MNFSVSSQFFELSIFSSVFFPQKVVNLGKLSSSYITFRENSSTLLASWYGPIKLIPYLFPYKGTKAKKCSLNHRITSKILPFIDSNSFSHSCGSILHGTTTFGEICWKSCLKLLPWKCILKQFRHYFGKLAL